MLTLKDELRPFEATARCDNMDRKAILIRKSPERQREFMPKIINCADRHDSGP